MPISMRSTRRSSSATTRSLRGRPVIVGGGVVLAASYEAKALRRPDRDGRHRRRARLCPRAIVVATADSRPTPRRARPCSQIFEETAPLVEGLSIDEAFLDVRGLGHISGSPLEIAAAAAPRESAGGRSADHRRARTHEVPGQGRECASRSPTGCSSCRPAAELEFLHPLPVERLWGVGRVTAAKLHARGITTVGRGRASSVSARSFRCSGRAIGPPPARARAQPRSAARTGRAAAAARSERSGRSGADEGRPSEFVDGADRARRSRRAPAAGGPARRAAPSCCGLRFEDFSRATRSHTLAEPTDRDVRDPRHRDRAAARGEADDRAARPDADRDLARQPG